MRISLEDAHRGAKLNLQLGDEEGGARTLEVTIPPGVSEGQKLRLRGRGIPGQPPGDLFLVLELVLPPATSPRARELYQAMARELAFDPRRQVRH